MAITSKPLSDLDSEQTLRGSFNDIDSSFTVAGFVTGKVGRKVTRTVIGATIDDYSYYEGSTLLYTIRVTFSDASHSDVNIVERTV